MRNNELEKCLNDLASGKISALNAYNSVSNFNYNMGLTTNYFKERWQVSNINEKPSSKGILIFSDKADSDALLGNTSNNIITVKNSLEYKFISKTKILINFNNSKHYTRLFDELEKNNFDIDIIVVQSNSSYEGNIKEAINATVIRAYDLVKAIVKTKQNKQFLCLWLYKDESLESCFSKAIKGFAKTAYEETQNIIVRTICIDKKDNLNNTMLQRIINIEGSDPSAEFEVKYVGNDRMVRRFYLLESIDSTCNITYKKNSAYIVSGGHGLIGRQVVKQLIKNGASKVVIIGRSSVLPTQLKEWFGEGADKIQYCSEDISDNIAVNRIRLSIIQSGYEIKGIINCSGIFKNSFIINKDEEDIFKVLSPKVSGTSVLHNTFLNDKLDFFIVFSSIAGVLGKVGQADYAYANSFLDSFCEYRESLRESGICSGKTICIHWPYWSEGGMAIAEYEIDKMYEELGATPLTNHYGMEAFSKILNSGASSYTVLYGKTNSLQYILENQNQLNQQESHISHEYEAKDLQNETIKWIIKLFGETFGLAANDLNLQIGFDELGIDSVGFNLLQTKLEKHLGPIKKTLLYETKNIGEIVDYLLDIIPDKLEQLFYVKKSPSSQQKDNVIKKTQGFQVKSKPKQADYNSKGLQNEDIAIIGMSGRFPHATNCRELWENLRDGKDCVGEIPSNRWDIDYYYCDDIKNLPEGKSYCRWGGFLSDVDKFDPQFFNMSPKESTMTDPQERIMLQVAYEVFEDAGYSKTRLKNFSDENGNALVGTFVSVASNTYNLIGVEQWERGNYIVPNALPWSLSNRISYFMNFSAPSFTVDAACAGGLVAIHQAINALKNDECKMALVGGANLYLHPYKYVSLSQVKMLSKTGKCHAFSEDADGFIPGESVAAVLLKPLKDAIRDHDKVYGVIKASAINHDADSNGYMAPSPKAQESLISNVINKAGIPARHISYIEAHGTGTPIGDPIEVNALTNAFHRTTADKQFCSIGSIKSNIGHSEGAAGIVGLIKVLLQMKHKTLVPTIHTAQLSSKIDFDNSPFRVQRTIQEWKKSVVLENGMEKELPRIAGISSFGAGGANGHILVQEYDVAPLINNSSKRVYVIPFSAKTQERLQVHIDLMYHYINKHENDLDILSVAYTLQIGRNEMEHRVAFVVDSLKDLIKLMRKYLENDYNSKCIFVGNAKRKFEANIETAGVKPESVEDACVIAEKWTIGNSICWEEILGSDSVVTELPTYPFSQKSCWVKQVEKPSKEISENTERIRRSKAQLQVKDSEENLEQVIQDIDNDEVDIAALINKLEKFSQE